MLDFRAYFGAARSAFQISNRDAAGGARREPQDPDSLPDGCSSGADDHSSTMPCLMPQPRSGLSWSHQHDRDGQNSKQRTNCRFNWGDARDSPFLALKRPRSTFFEIGRRETSGCRLCGSRRACLARCAHLPQYKRCHGKAPWKLLTFHQDKRQSAPTPRRRKVSM